MDLIDNVIQFFTNLVRQRVNRVQNQARSKAMSVQARARGKAAAAFNNTLDGGIQKAKQKAAGKPDEDDQQGQR